MPVRLILDTDIGTDVDDALALAFALRHPDIDLVAVTTVADDTIRRAQIALKLLRIAGRDDIEVAPGVGWGTSPSGRKSWFGHETELLDGDEPANFERDGVTLLVEETKSNALEISTIGMQSNIAAALERDPEFATRVLRLDVMGGCFAPVRIGDRELPPAVDHNLCVDPAASVRSLNSGIPSMYVPVDVTFHAPLPHAHHERLRTGDELCRELAKQIDVWMRFTGKRDDRAATLHDPLTIACIVDKRFVTTEELPVTVAMHDGTPRTFIDRSVGHPAEVITSVDAKGFADFWLETVLGSS
jgi:purine nucleosidase